ncbi:uncharacterized protein MKK02DRAFT_43527 [Dioszegia hungarica]|uniref:Uncharacterized protein n=1 Tax=Dioszegia hungarica TaxID=4972 RepID=A0AA38HEF6_9TREE|nr:uncharacterized protein MKK02DRAFT_43527 [Dioszegia hungarica]KAI9637601.1 hypothetical protein MKK02DRAFT_43527 [Dioszegia hungarica]
MSHAVFVPFAAWGHVRPLLHLVVQLVTLHPQLKATILLCPTVAPRVHKELASANLSHTRNTTDGASALGRVQLVEVQVKDAGTNEPGKPKDLVADMAADAIAYAEAISGYLAALFGEGAPGAPILGDKFKDIKPNMVIFDMFQSFVLAVVHQLSEQSGGKIGKIPVFAFVPSGPTSMIHHLAKEEYGGFIGPISRKVEEAVAEGQDPMPMIAAILGKAPVLAMFAMFQTFWSPYLTGTIGTAVEEMETEAKLFFEQHLGKPWLFVGIQYPENF